MGLERDGLTAGPTGGSYSHYSPDRSSGSSSARRGLSQKGDLPSSGEHYLSWSKVVDARIPTVPPP
jgi:hypothetical protein